MRHFYLNLADFQQLYLRRQASASIALMFSGRAWISSTTYPLLINISTEIANFTPLQVDIDIAQFSTLALEICRDWKIACEIYKHCNTMG